MRCAACAEPLLQLVCTVLQCEVAALTLQSGDQWLVMRRGSLESQEDTEASALWRHRAELPLPPCCRTLVIPDTLRDARHAAPACCGTQLCLKGLSASGPDALPVLADAQDAAGRQGAPGPGLLLRQAAVHRRRAPPGHAVSRLPQATSPFVLSELKRALPIMAHAGAAMACL